MKSTRTKRLPGFTLIELLVVMAYFSWDLPASYHNGAGGLSFADGHQEIKRWLDPRTTRWSRLNRTLLRQVSRGGCRGRQRETGFV